MNVNDCEMLKKIVDSSNITVGCCKQLTYEEIYNILIECL